LESEVKLLRHFGPSLPESLLRQLSSAFGDLRELVDRGLLAYPYSTRECVQIVRHLEEFPEEDISEALKNVFSFDSFDPQVQRHISHVFEKHEIPTEGVFKYSYASLGKGSPLQIEYHNDQSVSGPKHGKVDPFNAPHVGGNTWAGGTGGRDTAGLGGRGGPYRLDSGHPIHQIPDYLKNEVSEEVKAAAKQMAEEGLRQKLAETELSIEEAKMFESSHRAIRDEVNQLRVILQGLEAKEKERSWIHHQTSGDLDESKVRIFYLNP